MTSSCMPKVYSLWLHHGDRVDKSQVGIVSHWAYSFFLTLCVLNFSEGCITQTSTSINNHLWDLVASPQGNFTGILKISIIDVSLKITDSNYSCVSQRSSGEPINFHNFNMYRFPFTFRHQWMCQLSMSLRWHVLQQYLQIRLRMPTGHSGSTMWIE